MRTTKKIRGRGGRGLLLDPGPVVRCPAQKDVAAIPELWFS
jgi:hypothetical protein